MDTNSLTIADTLTALRMDIQAEHSLIAGRVTWYVTSQAFLLTAYAQSWNANFVWPYFFHDILPLAAMVLSAVILASTYGATWAQDAYLREQAALVARLQAELTLSPGEKLALDSYQRTMVNNRTTASGRIIGARIHALVRVTPLLLPFGFSLLWLYAYAFAPHLAK